VILRRRGEGDLGAGLDAGGAVDRVRFLMDGSPVRVGIAAASVGPAELVNGATLIGFGGGDVLTIEGSLPGDDFVL
jgi:hypothetical protein